jgi:hypothetical protein
MAVTNGFSYFECGAAPGDQGSNNIGNTLLTGSANFLSGVKDHLGRQLLLKILFVFIERFCWNFCFAWTALVQADFACAAMDLSNSLDYWSGTTSLFSAGPLS